MADAMRGATKAMRMMNRQLNLPQLQNIMREFERQNEKMEMSSEMMGDAIDDAMEVRGWGGSGCDDHEDAKQLGVRDVSMSVVK
jgi:division protein CdvB (Snf7/Vps24/ESCRT-III family)